MFFSVMARRLTTEDDHIPNKRYKPAARKQDNLVSKERVEHATMIWEQIQVAKSRKTDCM